MTEPQTPTNDTTADTAVATPPSVFDVADDAPASALAQKKKQFRADLQASINKGLNDLISLRQTLRGAVWDGKATLSAPQAWDALGEIGVSVADVSGKLDEFLELVRPGVIKGDVGVPADYELTFDPSTGRVTCTEKA